MKHQLNMRRVFVITLDAFVVLAAFVAAFLLRFDLRIDAENFDLISKTFPYVLAAYFLNARIFSLYKGIFHFSSFPDLINITKAVTSGGVLGAMIILFVLQGQFPRSVLILHPILTFLGICGVRFSIRLAKSYWEARGGAFGKQRNVLIVGAGEMGESIVRQMLKTPGSPYRIVGFIDDNPSKFGMEIHGHAVLGGRAALGDVLRKNAVDDIVIAIASRRGDIVRSIMDTLHDAPYQPDLKIAPSLEEMLKAPGEGISIRKVNPADLLNREVVHLDQVKIVRALAGRCVLVSGAGGTIGSELCRQALHYGPAKIVLVENHATSLFYQEAALKEKSHGAEIVPVLGDIRDNSLVERVFREHRPHVVLHAAAHKHVHQLEYNVQEGIGNNVLGTYYLASAADKFESETFLLVSTDKAVRPASVMGATKRAAELVVQSFACSSKTRFVAVRFGNVLGSSGSVLRIFQEQISKGGPITLTDPRATRYFMTVEEAVGLILQATSMAQGGEIYVLKMGTPVRIMDMAKNLILLSGLEPGKDIEIRVTGLRQGEKLDEELLEDATLADTSEHPDIMVLRSDDGMRGDMKTRILELEISNRSENPSASLRKLIEIVPTFKPAEAHLQGRPDTLPSAIDLPKHPGHEVVEDLE